MNKTLLRLLIGLAAIVISPHMAKADSMTDMIQISCDKTLKYFSLRTIQMLDRYDQSNDQEEIKKEISAGLYRPSVLLEQPYNCDIGGSTVTVQIINPVGSSCGGQGSFDLSIKRDGDEIYTFNAYQPEEENHCITAAYHLIEIVAPFSMKDCLIPEATGTTPSSCSYPGKQ
jgi:hypothetical protein